MRLTVELWAAKRNWGGGPSCTTLALWKIRIPYGAVTFDRVEFRGVIREAPLAAFMPRGIENGGRPILSFRFEGECIVLHRAKRRGTARSDPRGMKAAERLSVLLHEILRCRKD